MKQRARGWTDQAYAVAQAYVHKLTPNPHALHRVLAAAVEEAGARPAWPHRVQEQATWALRAAFERYQEAHNEPSVANIQHYVDGVAKAKALVDAVLRGAVGAR